jgi:hypothetical protein
MEIGAAFDPLDSFFHGANLPNSETADKFPGLGERAVEIGAPGAGEVDALAFGTWLKGSGIEKYAGFHHLLVEFAHVGEKLRTWHLARLGFRTCLTITMTRIGWSFRR